MKKINFIFLRSKVGNDSRFKDEEKARFLNALNANNDFIFDPSGEVNPKTDTLKKSQKTGIS